MNEEKERKEAVAVLIAGMLIHILKQFKRAGPFH